jgi:hypothetical protein
MMLLVCAAAFRNAVKRALKTAEILYWQSRCSNFEEDPTVTVSEESHTTEITKSINDGTARRAYPSGRLGTIGFRRPSSCWPRFTGLWLAPYSITRIIDNGGLVFLHARRSGKTERIVVVTWTPWLDDRPLMLSTFQITTITPGNWSRSPVDESSLPVSITGGTRLEDEFKRRFRIFAGQADPNDESHFCIGYELDDGKGTIDGYLEDTGYVQLRLRE